MRNTTWMNAWRVGALMVVIGVSVLNVVHSGRTVPPAPVESPAVATDPVMRHERRLAALHASVCARGLKGTIGYLGDLPHGRLAEDAKVVEDYYRTQFVLIPLVLDSQLERHEWAVTNLRTEISQTRLPEEWRIVEDFGAGVLLLKKISR